MKHVVYFTDEAGVESDPYEADSFQAAVEYAENLLFGTPSGTCRVVRGSNTVVTMERQAQNSA